MYKYETHLHTLPVSKCAKAGVREVVEYYKEIGYDGIFITNHFIDGNIDAAPDMSYEDKIEFYFSDYEEALEIGKEFVNHMAKFYVENYGLLEFAGSDNHDGKIKKNLAGMCSEEPIEDEQDFVNRVKNGEMKTFTFNAE